MTTRGAKEEMQHIGHLIGVTLKNRDNTEKSDKIRNEVDRITNKYPMFAEEWIPKVNHEVEEI